MKILIAVDDSPCSRAAVQFVRRMQLPAATRVTILSAVQVAVPVYSEVYVPTADTEEIVKDKMRAHQELVSRAELELRDTGFVTKARVLEGDPRALILRAAREEQADMIVVGSHGRSGLAKLVMGSVAAHIMSHAPCSVLVVKTGEARE